MASATRTVHGVKLGVVALGDIQPLAPTAKLRQAVEKGLHNRSTRGLASSTRPRERRSPRRSEAQLIASVFIPKGPIVSTRERTQPTETLSATGQAPIAPRFRLWCFRRPEHTPRPERSSPAALCEVIIARATVVGTHTFGKGVFQEEEPLSNGGALDITVGEYFTPNGRNLGGGGVKQGRGYPQKCTSHGVDTPHGLAVALSTLAAKVMSARRRSPRRRGERSPDAGARGRKPAAAGAPDGRAMIEALMLERGLARGFEPGAGARNGAAIAA